MKNKKEQPVRQEQSMVIDINLTRGLLILLALVLVVAACLVALAWEPKEASASAPAAPAAFDGMRKYYLTQSTVEGNGALSACASGYHMASLWEILDPSNLEYNTDLGYTRADSGEGPPHYRAGWVRTGWDSSTDSGVGRDNCAVWTSNSSGNYGTGALLPPDWTGGGNIMHIWTVARYQCTMLRYVWCVED